MGTLGCFGFQFCDSGVLGLHVGFLQGKGGILVRNLFLNIGQQRIGLLNLGTQVDDLRGGLFRISGRQGQFFLG